MWIKWKYNDHGWPDFEELEVPDNVLEEYESMVDYLEVMKLIPAWSERYSGMRVKWEKIEVPSEIYLNSLIKSTNDSIKTQRAKLKYLQELKKEHYIH